VGLGDFQLESLERREFLSVAPAITAASATRRVADRAGSTFATARNAGVLKTSKRFSDFVGTGDGTDFYKFKMARRATVNIDLSGSSNKVRIALIQDKNGNGKLDRGETLGQQGGASTSRAISKVLSPATYFVRVQLAKGSDNYTLKFTASPLDAGDTMGSAVKVIDPNGTLFFNESVGGSDPADFYLITFSQTTHLILAMGELSGNADLELIQDTNGNGIADASEILATSTNPDTQNEGMTWHSAAGTYFVRVNAPGTGAVSYSLQFVTFPMS
jgi:hypothetical protein